MSEITQRVSSPEQKLLVIGPAIFAEKFARCIPLLPERLAALIAASVTGQIEIPAAAAI